MKYVIQNNDNEYLLATPLLTFGELKYAEKFDSYSEANDYKKLMQLTYCKIIKI